MKLLEHPSGLQKAALLDIGDESKLFKVSEEHAFHTDTKAMCFDLHLPSNVAMVKVLETIGGKIREPHRGTGKILESTSGKILEPHGVKF